jgi:hypothetical protein
MNMPSILRRIKKWFEDNGSGRLVKPKQQKELCHFCGGTGFKMVTTYEGNSEFHILSSSPQKCQVCSKQ